MTGWLLGQGTQTCVCVLDGGFESASSFTNQPFRFWRVGCQRIVDWGGPILVFSPIQVVDHYVCIHWVLLITPLWVVGMLVPGGCLGIGLGFLCWRWPTSAMFHRLLVSWAIHPQGESNQ